MWRERSENIQLIQTQIFCHWIIQINIQWRRPTSHLIGAELGWNSKDCLRASTESRIFQCFSLVCECEIWILNQLWRQKYPAQRPVHLWLVTQRYGSHTPKIYTQCWGGPLSRYYRIWRTSKECNIKDYRPFVISIRPWQKIFEDIHHWTTSHPDFTSCWFTPKFKQHSLEKKKILIN